MTKPVPRDMHREAPNWDSHIIANRVEDAKWLMSQGYTLEQAARQMHIEPNTLEKTLERHG